MASDCEVLVEGDDRQQAIEALRVAHQESQRIEQKYSRYRDDNVIARINGSHGEPVSVDAETGGLLDFASQIYELSEGKFDPTSGVLRRVWRFDGSDNLPEGKKVEALLPLLGWHRVSWDGAELRMPPGMELDLGGIGKEYAADRAAQMVSEAVDAGVLINLGGDIRVSRPCAGDRPWQVGIEPVPPATTPTVVSFYQGGLATSGDARRFLQKDGVRYGHVLDPSSGWPVVDAPRSVTVAAPSCLEAGAIATLAILQGEGAEEFLQQQGFQYWCRR